MGSTATRPINLLSPGFNEISRPQDANVKPYLYVRESCGVSAALVATWQRVSVFPLARICLHPCFGDVGYNSTAQLRYEATPTSSGEDTWMYT